MNNKIEEKLSVDLTLDYDATSVINHTIEALVSKRVDTAVNKLVDEAVKNEISNQIRAIVTTALDTKIKTYDYNGDVKSERSVKDCVLEAMKAVQEEGLNYHTTKIDSYGRRQEDLTLNDVIKRDVYLVVKEKLAPQFEIIEKEFKAKTAEALREFAIKAVDSSTQKTLRGY